MTEVIAVPASLTRELVTKLAHLDGLPDATAGLALRKLGVGSRMSLIAHGIVDQETFEGRDPDAQVLTPYGREVIAACAASRRSRRNPKSMPIGAVARFGGPVRARDAIFEHIAARLARFPRFTRLADGQACELDLERHVVIDTCDDLAQRAGEIFSQPWDEARPPWGVWILDGIDGGGFAVISKADPALLEHLGGVDLLGTLFDVTGRPLAPSHAPKVGVAPAREPFDFEELRRMNRALAKAGIADAPLSPLNVRLSPTRRIGFASVPLSDDARSEHGHRTSNLLLAATAGALGAWLDNRQSRVDGESLRAALVSISGTDGEPALEDRLSLRLVDLPLDDRELYGRLQAADDRGENILEHLRTDPAGRLSFGHAQVFLRQRFSNVLVARYPAMSVELYFMEREMRSLHPIAFLADDHALSIAGVRYDGHLHVGVIGDGDVMHDVDAFTEAFEAELAQLVAKDGG